MNLEKRKQIEMTHYDKNAQRHIKNKTFPKRDIAVLRLPDTYIKNLIKNKTNNKKVLDFACGSAQDPIELTKMGAKVTGIDISPKAIFVGKIVAKNQGLLNKIQFKVMDGEKMDFKDNSFDIIHSAAAFTSANLESSLKEWSRILKPKGFAIGRDTLGDNPLINLKRKLNYSSGKRTKYTKENLMRTKDLKIFRRYFKKVEFKYFNLLTLFLTPIIKSEDSKILKLFSKLDDSLFKFPFFQRNAFKIVFLLSNPIKNQNDKKNL
ncbi:hypothetical protein CMI45_00425 [Candidatus Pacearchaeota archaeon]|nr:hypothetical protein [Candidatus Pacearchaeota archaeon]|tara:strand:+ start:705 stop:1496 length:792 start_codon:yes stop_codon:yes gene_type:complete